MMKREDYEYIRFNYNIGIIIAFGGGAIFLIIGIGFLRDFLGIHPFSSSGFSSWWISLFYGVSFIVCGILVVLMGTAIIFNFYIKKVT